MKHTMDKNTTKILIELGFKDELELIKESKCPSCGKKINPYTDFNDQLSIKEWSMSGLCQECQDKFFTD